MTHPQHAAERVRARLQEWIKIQGHGSRTRLARAVQSLYGEKKSKSWATDVLKGGDKGSDLRLRDLDDVAELLDVPPGDLVRRPDDHYLEVTPTEMRLLKYFRAVPDVIRHHMMAYFDYIFSFQQEALEEQRAERQRRTDAARQELADRRQPQRIS